jgi:hypothetical protein
MTIQDQIIKKAFKVIAPKIQEAIEEAVVEKLFRDFDVSVLKTPQEAGNMSFALVEPSNVAREVGRLGKSDSIIDKIVGMYVEGLYRKDGKVFRLTDDEKKILIQKIKAKLGN